MTIQPEKLPAAPQLPTREYPFAHELREGFNRSHHRIDRLNAIQILLLAVAVILAVIALLL